MELCSFVIKRKSRNCKMKAQGSSKFCAQHFYLDKNILEGKPVRIPCPLDPNHSCFANKLKTHLKKCNSREKSPSAYFKKHINSSGLSSLQCPKKIKLGELEDQELLRIIQKIEDAYKKFVLEQPKVVFTKDEDTSPELIGLKHQDQQEALVVLMKKSLLLSDSTGYIELGAGRGQMTCHIAKNIPNPDSCHFILVDRKAFRYKQDVKLKHELGAKVERIRIDIEHLDLGKLTISHPIVGVSKHLCGAATDLSLKSLLETVSTSNLKGIVIALCCHHRCEWSSYVGRDSFLEWGFVPEEFPLVCTLSSWATCGRMPNSEHALEKEPQQAVSRYQRLEMSPDYREQFGYKCKRLLDEGRLAYIKKHGLKTELLLYIDSTVSLENVALVATKE